MSTLTMTYKPDDETFSDFLKRVRLGFDVRDKDFAAFLGVQQHVLDRWLSGDTRYIRASRRAKWEEMGIHSSPAQAGTGATSVFEQLRNEVESLADDDGNLLYSESDLAETIEWIQLFKASKERKTPAALIRKWARDNGHVVPAKGRVPTRVKIAYSLANEA